MFFGAFFLLYSESRPIQTISLCPFVVDSPLPTPHTLVFPTTESHPLWGSVFMKGLIKFWPDVRLFLCLLCSHELLRSCVTGSMKTRLDFLLNFPLTYSITWNMSQIFETECFLNWTFALLSHTRSSSVSITDTTIHPDSYWSWQLRINLALLRFHYCSQLISQVYWFYSQVYLKNNSLHHSRKKSPSFFP